MAFNGFKREAFEFLLEITFNNNIEWFNANRKRFEVYVRDPLRCLCSELMPTALSIDPAFNPRVTSSVSRIRRDTRFTYDKSPFRNHMWIAFRYPNTRVSEGCALYFEITPNGYSYGFGFYAASASFMAAYRKKVIADPAGFLSLAGDTEKFGFEYDAERYKKDRFPDAPEAVKPYINVKSFAWCKHFDNTTDLIEPSDVLSRLRCDFESVRPMYEFMRSTFDTVN